MAVTAVGTPTLVRSTTSPVTGTQGSGQTWANGNVLLAFVTAAASTSVTAISTPAGWTKLPEVAEPGGTAIIRIAYYWIVSNGAVSAPAFTSTITGTGVMTCTIMELTGANTASPVLTSGSGTGTTTNAVAAPTTGSVTLTGCYAVAAACQFVTTAGTVTITYGATSGTVPSNLANDGTTSSTSHTGVGAVVGPATGAVFSGFVNFTTAGTQIAGYDIVIQPPPPVVVFQPNQYPPTRYISRAGHRRKWLPRQPAIYTPAAPIAIIQVSSTVETPTGSLPATTVVTVTLTHPTGTGNTLVACLTAGGSATAPVVSSVTLGGSADHWRAAITDDSGISIFSGAIWYDPNAASGQTSVVVTFTGGTGTGGDTYVTIYEVGAILAFDKGSDGDSGSLVTTWSSGTTSTIMQANEIFFGVSTASNAIPVVTGAGIWTTQSTGAGTWDQISGYQAVITQGTAAFSGTLPGGGGLYTALVATFYIGASSAQYTETFVVIVAVTDVNQNQVQRNQVTPVAVTGAQQRSVRKTVGTVTAVTSAVTRQILRTVITVLAIIAGVVRTTQRPLTSNVAVISVLTAMRVRMTTLAASLAATSQQTRSIGRGFIVPVAILGAITRKITRTVTAPVATMAAVIRQMTHTFLTPTAITGTVTRSAARVLSAPVAVTASSTRMVIRVLNAAAAVTFGVLNRKLTRTVTAPLAVAAATVRVTARNLTTTVAVTGSVAIQKFKQVTLTAVTALGAATTRNISRSFQVPAAITANITRNITKTYITVIAVPGTVTRKINRGLITVTVLAGNTKNSIGKLLQTPAAIAGSHARNVGKGFTAPVAVSSTVTRSIARVVTAVFAVTAGITRMVGRSLAAPIAVAIAFTANATHGVIDVTLNTVIAVTGTITRNTNRILQTPVATPVTVTRMINRILITSAAVSSVFTAIKAKFLTLTASVAATAGISRQTGKIITGQAAVTGSLVNRVSKNVATVIAVIPAVTRRTGKTVIGVITVTGALSQIKLRNVILAATTAVTGNIQRKVMPNLKTSLIIVVGNIRSITRTIQGTLGIAGQTVRGIGRVFTAPIAVISGITQTKFKSVILAVSIAVTTVVQKKIFKIIPATVAVTLQTVKGLFTRFKANVAVPVVFSTGKTYFFTFIAGVSVVVSVTAQAMTNLQDLVFKQGVAGFQWIVSSVKKQWKT